VVIYKNHGEHKKTGGVPRFSRLVLDGHKGIELLENLLIRMFLKQTEDNHAQGSDDESGE
jgi:hypothetical protein